MNSSGLPEVDGVRELFAAAGIFGATIFIHPTHATQRLAPLNFLIQLRLNRSDSTRGLTGSGLNTFHQNQSENMIAFHRWYQGGPGDDVVVVINLSHQAQEIAYENTR